MVAGRASVLLPVNELLQCNLLLGTPGQNQLHTLERTRLRYGTLIERTLSERVGVAFEEDPIAIVHRGHDPRCGALGEGQRRKRQAQK
jgi:hypothetical protein